VQSSAVQFTSQFNGLPFSGVQSIAVQLIPHSLVECSAVESRAVRCSAVQYSVQREVQASAEQFTSQFSGLPCSAVQ
jgi:antirestriction protein